MNIERMKIKLEDMDYETVYAIWDEYCNQEPPKQWQLISEIIEIAEQDSDVFEAIENAISDPQANGFHNIPAECESDKCNRCTRGDALRRMMDCPYVD